MIGRWDGIIENEVDERTVQRCARACGAKMARALKARNEANAQLRVARREWHHLVRVAKKLNLVIRLP